MREQDVREQDAQPDLDAVEFLLELRERLGAESPLLADPEYEITPRGRLVIHAGGLIYFRDERNGTLSASRVRGGRAEFAYVEPGGRMVWTMAPLGQPASN